MRFKLLSQALAASIVIGGVLPVLANDNVTNKNGAYLHHDDCTVITIDSSNDDDLTRQEKIAEMDDALEDSVNRYDTCVINDIGSGSSGQGQNGGGTGNGKGKNTDLGTGTQTQDDQALQNNTASVDETTNEPPSNMPNRELEGSGAIPKDIPPADNDSVFQRQIREAAMKETDPVKKQRLWDLYRKYKK